MTVIATCSYKTAIYIAKYNYNIGMCVYVQILMCYSLYTYIHNDDCVKIAILFTFHNSTSMIKQWPNT